MTKPNNPRRWNRPLPHRIPAADIPVADAGLQPERTSLSWSRTSLALMVCSATLLRWAFYYPWLVYAAIGILAVLAVVISLTQRQRYATDAKGIAREGLPPNIVPVFAMAAGMGILGGLGLYLVGVTL